jgi:hypothetical protein
MTDYLTHRQLKSAGAIATAARRESSQWQQDLTILQVYSGKALPAAALKHLTKWRSVDTPAHRYQYSHPSCGVDSFMCYATCLFPFILSFVHRRPGLWNGDGGKANRLLVWKQKALFLNAYSN